MFSIQDINNSVLNSKRAMPQKDSTSDGGSTFEMARQVYTKTVPIALTQLAQKKWQANRDASDVAAKRRMNAIGKGTMPTTATPLAFTTVTPDRNVYNDAIRRVRAGGSVAPPKKNAMRTNGLTPAFRPQPIGANEGLLGIKYPVLYH